MAKAAAAKTPAVKPATVKAAPSEDAAPAIVGKKVEGTVSRGRTVVHDKRTYGPGDKIELPRADFERLVALGAVLDPKGRLTVAYGIGPDYGSEKIIRPNAVR